MYKLLQRSLIIAALTILTLTAGNSHAEINHHGHNHKTEPIDRAAAETKAIEMKNKFIKKKVIDESWKDIKVDTSYTEMYDGKEEWVITFKNDEIKDVKKQKLYVFLKIDGKYIAANFTGE